MSENNILGVVLAGGKSKIDSFIELLDAFGVLEVMRTGRIATLRGATKVGININVGKKEHKENFKHVFHRPVRRKLQATQLNSSASYSEMWTKGGLVSVQVIVPVFI